MIEGTVNSALEAVIAVPVSGPTGQVRVVEAVIDTGYYDYLTLPPALVAELRLPHVGESQVTLVDGSVTILAAHNATVVWNGRSRAVAVDAADTTPLVGMALLEGHNLNIDVHPAGQVCVESIRAA